MTHPDDAEPVTTIAGLARAMCVSQQTASKWVKKGAPRREDGSFDLQAVKRWVHDYRSLAKRRWQTAETPEAIADLGRRAAAAGPGGLDSLDPAKQVKIDLDRQKLKQQELKTEQMRGNLIERPEVARMLVARARAFRRSLGAVARRIARRVLSMETVAEVQAAIGEEHDRILFEIYQQQQQGAGDDALGESA